MCNYSFTSFTDHLANHPKFQMIFEGYPTVKGQEVQFNKLFSVPSYTAGTKMLIRYTAGA